MDMVNQIRAKYNTVIENLLKKYSEELFVIATSSTIVFLTSVLRGGNIINYKYFYTRAEVNI